MAEIDALQVVTKMQEIIAKVQGDLADKEAELTSMRATIDEVRHNLKQVSDAVHSKDITIEALRQRFKPLSTIANLLESDLNMVLRHFADDEEKMFLTQQRLQALALKAILEQWGNRQIVNRIIIPDRQIDKSVLFQLDPPSQA